MRLFPGAIPSLSADIVRTLLEAKDIEAEAPREVEADLASVLKSYVEQEREVADKAKDLMQARNLGTQELGRMRKLVADQRGFKAGDEMVDYLLDQLVSMLLHSTNVDEVYAEDVELRRKMAPVLKRHLAVDEQLEQETRARLKHVQEGTRTWEVEYRRVMEDIRRRKGI
jgi:hypothetical protein